MKQISGGAVELISEGIVFSGKAGTSTANCCFTAIARLEDGTLLVSWRGGSSKDSVDGTILMSRSTDGGRTWEEPLEPFSSTFEEKPGDLHYGPITVLGENHLIAALMWIDRTDPTLPMFNPETEAMLPTQVLFSESQDGGRAWSELRSMLDTTYQTPLALTGPVLKMKDGRLACPFEVYKNYDDPRPWRHVPALKFSTDRGVTWPKNVEVAHDESERLFYWDQRHAVGQEGNGIAAFWTVDHVNGQDVNIHISKSDNHGQTWSKPRDTSIQGQVCHPILLRDGRLVIVYVDRYSTRSIRARLSTDGGDSFLDEELIIYQQPFGRTDPGQHPDMAEYLEGQQLWSFGRVEGLEDPDGIIWVVYYAGDERSTSIHWAHLCVD